MKQINCVEIRNYMLNIARMMVNNPKNIKLVVIQVEGDKASDGYIRSKKRACEELGFQFEHIKFPNNIKYGKIEKVIQAANDDVNVTGIMLQLPLPNSLAWCEERLIDLIDPKKDVDGLTTQNVGRLWNDKESLKPCTAQGIISMLFNYEINYLKSFSKTNVCIIGRSKLIGKPLVYMFQKRFDSTVTLCHSKTEDIKKHTLEADIVVLATGKAKMFDKTYFKNDAVVVDAGIAFDENGKMCGDADSDTFKDTDIIFTPVPKGVGIITVAQLMINLCMAYHLQHPMDIYTGC